MVIFDVKKTLWSTLKPVAVTECHHTHSQYGNELQWVYEAFGKQHGRLLTIEEAEMMPPEQLALGFSWWLDSDAEDAAIVLPHGTIKKGVNPASYLEMVVWK